MKTLLVTGATGFLGKNVLQALEETDFEVHAVSSHSHVTETNKCFWHKADLLDVRQVHTLLRQTKPKFLLHLAWYVEHNKYWNSANNFLWVQSSLELFKTFQEFGGKRIVVAGTCAEYDWRYGVCSEAYTPMLPNSTYGACKYALSYLLESFAKINNLSWAWGRIFFPYGPYENENRLIPYVIRSLLQNQAALCSTGLKIRDFSYVQDVATAFVKLLDSKVEGTINVASGNPVMLKDVVLMIGEILNKKDLIFMNEVTDRVGEPKVVLADTEKILRELNWSSKCHLEEGLRRTINWWSESLN